MSRRRDAFRRQGYYLYATVASSLAASALIGCTPNSTDTNREVQSASTTPSVRQLDDDGQKLPFENAFADRWNSSNDGTEYEPCTAMTPDLAVKVGIDITSTKDAATVSGQTLRGCRWDYEGTELTGWTASQVVANFAGLQAYKEDNSTFSWRPDIELNGRQIGVASMNSFNCFTYMQSRDSGVVTEVMYIGEPKPPLDEICQRAIDLTKATIDKIPE